jgi:ribosome-associated translation inhibitor RaiA
MEVRPEITIENKIFKVEKYEQSRNEFDAQLQLKYSSDQNPFEIKVFFV